MYGFGRMFRSGVEKNRPSWEYVPSFHILKISGITSSHMSLVILLSGTPKPVTSIDPDPRPVPNSKRPPE